MNYFSFQALNCNSLVRSNLSQKGNLFSPFLPLLKKTSDICFLSDVRISQDRLDYLNKQVSMSDVIGREKTRFFSTISDGMKTGGCGIFVPQIYDDILKVIHVTRDVSAIPRFISLVCELAGGPKLLLSSFYGSPGNAGEKAKILRKFYKHLYETTKRFGISLFCLGGDLNISLDRLNENEKGTVKETFSKIVNDFSLNDAFISCPPHLNKKDVSRLAKQDQTATYNSNGFTFYPKIVGHRRSRIDAIFFSASLERNMIEKSFCLSQGNAFCDHKAVHFSFAWVMAGIPEGKSSPDFFFHNSLLELRSFRRKIRKDIADTIIRHYRNMGGNLSYELIRNIQIDRLEALIFDRAKNTTSNFSAIDIIYDIFQNIAKSQNIFLKKRSQAEKNAENSLITKIEMLEKISKPSRNEQRLLIAANKELSDRQKRKIWRQAANVGIEYEALGEEGSRHFLRSKISRRNDSFVRIFEKSDGQIIHDSFLIEEQFFEYYKNLLEAPDPFSTEAFYKFVNPFLDCFGKITEEDRVCFQSPITMQELNYAIKRVRSNVCPGPDGISGKLLTFLHSICPRLICHSLNHELLEGKCADKEIMLRKIIFLAKPTNKITIKRWRPISLMNGLYKVADSCIVNRLVVGLQNGNILPPFMSAYRAGFSTLDAILSLQTFIDNAMFTKRKLVILNWDVSQAFDRCSRLMVQEILKILGFSNFIKNAIANLPIGAQARLCINLAETRFPKIFAANGCAQGQASSAQCFSLATLVILLRLNMQDISSFKIQLGVQKKIPKMNLYTEYLWKFENGTVTPYDQINANFKIMAKRRWKHLSKEEKLILGPEINDRSFHQQTIKTLSEISSMTSFSDDGHYYLAYNGVQDILKIMRIFKEFGVFSGLMINPDKTKLISLNFDFSEEEICCLESEGFDRSMISDGNSCFRFLGCDIQPYFLRTGALSRLDDLCNDIEKIAKAFDGNTTLKGRKIVCESLMLSKLQAALTGFDLNEKDFSKLQMLIDKFCHKKNNCWKEKIFTLCKGWD